MNGISDVLTVGIVLTLVFGALFIYLYSRISQLEQRISLSESMLIELKMATESIFYQKQYNTVNNDNNDNNDNDNNDNDNNDNNDNNDMMTGESKPFESTEVEVVDEEYYKNVLNNLHPANELNETELNENVDLQEEKQKVNINYEALTLKELKVMAKQNNLSFSSTSHKKDLIELLKKSNITELLNVSPMEETLDNNVVD